MARGKKKKTSSSSSRKKATEQKSLLWRLMRFGLIVALWCALVLGTIVAWYAAELPEITEAPQLMRRNAITVKADNGDVLARYGDLKGVSVPVSELPPHLIYAVLSTEDRRFYKHHGVDPVGLARAMAANVRAGRIVQGGSTITQQLAKNLFLSPARTFKRKVQEALLALWIEQNLTKDEILSAYLNRVYMGSGTIGVQAAAEVYYKKPASDLTLRESATIAGLLKAPSRYSPIANPNLSAERANVVLRAMADAGYITEEEAEKMTSSPPVPGKKPLEANSIRYFTDWVTRDLDMLVGEPALDMTITTTINPVIQDAAESALATYLRQEGAEKNVSQGAVIILGYDGAVLAMVGGFDYMRSQFNRAVDAQRQPGSSFKPFVYLTALQQGWTPNSVVLDAPITEGKYRPGNYGDEFYGDVPLAMAMAYSLNTAAVRIAQQVGVDNIVENARSAGIRAPLHGQLSLALGTSEVPMIQMVNAYATLARGGLYLDPYAIRKVVDKDNRLLYQRSNAVPARRVLDERPVRQLQGVMQLVVQEGTGRAAAGPYRAAGKTGTSQDFRDAWFIGFTDRYIGLVWVGNDDNTSMKRVTGGSIPARIWRDTMTVAHRQRGHGGGFISSLFGGGPDYDMAPRMDQPVAINDNRPPPAQPANDNSDDNEGRFRNFLDSFTGRYAHEDEERYN